MALTPHHIFSMQGSGSQQDRILNFLMESQENIKRLDKQAAALQSQVVQLQDLDKKMRETASLETRSVEIAAQIVHNRIDEMLRQIQTSKFQILNDINAAKDTLRQIESEGRQQLTQSRIQETIRMMNDSKQYTSQAIREIHAATDSMKQEVRGIQESVKQDVTRHVNEKINELVQQAAQTKNKTIDELQQRASTEIEKLKKEFDLTANEAARLKREFKIQFQERKERFQKAERLASEEAAKELEKLRGEHGAEKARIKGEEKRKGAVEKRKIEIGSPEFREMEVQKIKDGIKVGIDTFTENLPKIAMTTGLTIAGVLAVKHALPIIRKKIEDALFTPALIDDSSFTGFAGYFTKKSLPDQQIANLYFNPKLKAQVDRIISVLKNTSKNKGYYLNYLFYGEPGTGKTATARAMAYESGMDYAIMSGGNVQKLLASGKAEEKLKEVFNWAKKSNKGMLLFIDEADAFLKDPNKYAMTDELYAVLNSFLNMTGTESKNIAIIMSTNHPQNLPKAVLDRVGPGQFIYFGLPEYPQRLRIARHFVDKYLGKYFYRDVSEGEEPGIDEQLKDDITEYIAQKTDKFSGRNISYLILAIEKALQAEGHTKISKELIDLIVEEAAAQQRGAQEFKTFA